MFSISGSGRFFLFAKILLCSAFAVNLVYVIFDAALASTGGAAP